MLVPAESIRADLSLPREVTATGDGVVPTPSPSAMSKASERPEAQLLLACAHAQLDAATSVKIRSLVRAEIDWDYFLLKANQHGITPLVYQALNSAARVNVPPKVLATLQTESIDNARFNLYRTGELIKLLRMLGDNGIPALPFKGPVLSSVAYGNFALRMYGDLDVLVRRHDVQKTRDLLLARGYRLASLSDRHRSNARFSNRNKDLVFDSEDGLVRVELHWLLTGKHFNFPLDLNRLWARLETTRLAGALVPTLAPEDLLLYLCMHGSRHGWERLLWVCDVAELIRRNPTIKWDEVVKQARKLGCERLLAFGLLLADELVHARLPESLRQKIQSDALNVALARQVREALFLEAGAFQDISYWHDIHVRMRERLRDRVRLHLHYCRRYLRLALVPNENDRAILTLPRRLSSLYYILRPFRLLKGFGLANLKKFITAK